MRFELIDQVIQTNPDRIVAVKAVTAAEEYLADHFPGFPVLPGVLMLEALVQAGRKLLGERTDKPLVLMQARNVKYGSMVRPGQCLTVEVELKGGDGKGYDLSGVGRVGDRIAVQGRFRLAPLDV